MRELLCFLMLLSLPSCASSSAKTATPKADSPVPAAKAYTLEELDAAALVLRVAFDGEPESACGIGSQEAAGLVSLMQARLDDKKAEMAKTSTAAGWPTLAAINACEKACHCGIYSDLRDLRPAPSKAYAASLKKAALKAKRQTPQQSKTCAAAEKWFCSSELLKDLRSEARSISP